MAKLDKKYEEFAQAVAIGATLTEAGRRAGFSTQNNKAYLSRLSKKPEIATRIEKIKRDRRIALYESQGAQNFRAGATMAELGFTEDWILQSYLAIYRAALDAGAHPAANVAMQQVQKMVQKRDAALANGEEQPAQVEREKIKTTDLIGFLKDMKEAMGAPEPETGPSQAVNNLRHRYDRD